MAKKESKTVDNRQKALNAALAMIEKEHGKGAIMILGDDSSLSLDTEVIPTGIMQLDRALGIGGFPRGRVVEIYGPEASGKTTIALHAIASAQKNGGTVAFIDAEHALDLSYAKALGIQTDKLLVSQPDDGEQALDIAETLVRSNAIDMIVIDSVAALTPRAEIEGDITDTSVGLQARLMSKALRKITGSINKSKSIVVFINQMRANIATMGYGPKETTTGGKALKYFSSQRIEIRRIGSVKAGTDVIGQTVKIKIAKNKLASPFKEFTTDITYGIGIDHYAALIDLGIEYGFVKKAGAWFSINNEKLGQGKENSKKKLKEDLSVRVPLERKIYDKLGVKYIEPEAYVEENASPKE